MFSSSLVSDAVVRTSYYKYFHPKEALVSSGVLNRSILQQLKALKASGSDVTKSDETLSYVYPFGATLNVTKPAVAVLSTGSMCFPVQRPTCAFVPSSSGRLVVLASAHVFHDTYIQKEDNFFLQEIIFQFFSSASFSLNPIDAGNPDILEYSTIPDLEHLSDQTISCLLVLSFLLSICTPFVYLLCYGFSS